MLDLLTEIVDELDWHPRELVLTHFDQLQLAVSVSQSQQTYDRGILFWEKGWISNNGSKRMHFQPSGVSQMFAGRQSATNWATAGRTLLALTSKEDFPTESAYLNLSSYPSFFPSWCSPRRIFWWRADGGRFGHLIKCLIECESKQCSPDTHLAYGGRFGIFLKYSYKQKTIDHRQNLSGAREHMEILIESVKILYWRPSL